MIHQTIQGTAVPALGFGTWQLRGDACAEAVRHALALGYRHLDTAQIYENEAEVGQGIAAAGVPREDFFLTTKLWRDHLAPKAVRRSTEDSLRRLGVDYVDLLLIHWPTDEMDLPAVLDAMLALQAAGKTRHIGVSNFPVSLVEQALAHTPLFAHQLEYHPFLAQDRHRALAQQHDFLLTAYCPIARGRVMDDETIQAIAEAHNKTAVQVTLRWLLQQDHVAAIPKAASPRHRAANLNLFDFTLTPDEMARLDALARGQRLIDPPIAPDWDA